MVGHETTSCSVIFTLLELSRHPEVQQRLREEIQGLTEFTYDNISKLEYLDAVTKEGCVFIPCRQTACKQSLIFDRVQTSFASSVTKNGSYRS